MQSVFSSPASLRLCVRPQSLKSSGSSATSSELAFIKTHASGYRTAAPPNPPRQQRTMHEPVPLAFSGTRRVSEGRPRTRPHQHLTKVVVRSVERTPPRAARAPAIPPPPVPTDVIRSTRNEPERNADASFRRRACPTCPPRFSLSSRVSTMQSVFSSPASLRLCVRPQSLKSSDRSATSNELAFIKTHASGTAPQPPPQPAHQQGRSTNDSPKKAKKQTAANGLHSVLHRYSAGAPGL